jgi:hypothetical protein
MFRMTRKAQNVDPFWKLGIVASINCNMETVDENARGAWQDVENR